MIRTRDSTRVLLVTWIITILVIIVHGERDRTCCSYSCRSHLDEDDHIISSCPTWCPTSDACVFRNQSGIISDRRSGCRVDYDSKFQDILAMTREQCLEADFTSDTRFSSDELPFYIVAYPFKDSSQLESHFTGIDLRYKASGLQKLNFRLKNTNQRVCPDTENVAELELSYADISDMMVMESQTCKPRCVQIQIDPVLSRTIPEDTYLSYDCEAGFYVHLNNWISSSHHDYQLSVCETRTDGNDICGHYMFQLPDISDDVSELRLLLLDKDEYDKSDTIVLWTPVTHGAVEMFNVQVLREIDNVTQIETVYNENMTVDVTRDMYQIRLDTLSLSSGRYQVLVTPIISGVMETSMTLQSVHLTRPSYGQRTLAFVTAVLVTVLIVGVVLIVYRQWQIVAEQGAVEPGNLVSTGRMESQNVLIITPLDNPDHVEIVQILCRYLKEWCGVGKTYFAFDETTGIGVDQNDPWKWCQETGDQVKSNGHVIYIAGPDPGLSNNVSVFPDLEHNQAFVTTRHLQTLDSEGRVMVVKFGYSHMKTIPKEVPDHLKSSCYNLPKQMNKFLVHLLQVKKKALCKMLPFQLVKPEIKPSSLTRPGGAELLQKIHDLCLKDAKHKQAVLQGHSEAPIIKNSAPNGVKIADKASAAESAALLSKEIANFNKKDETKDKTLHINLEPTLPSVTNMDNRDRLDVE